MADTAQHLAENALAVDRLGDRLPDFDLVQGWHGHVLSEIEHGVLGVGWHDLEPRAALESNGIEGREIES